MDVLVRGLDLNFDYDLHSLVSSFSGDPEVKIIKEGEDPAALIVEFGEDSARICLWGDSVTVPVGRGDRRASKNALKRGVYGVLSRYYKKELPWGTLSGVRPTKLPVALLDSMSEGQVFDRLKETYLVSDKKCDLAIQVAKRERKILSGTGAADGYSLYIGIPFCPSRCAYCSFTSYPIEAYASKAEDYILALIRELEAIHKLMEGRALKTVYIGGGTPTSLPEGLLDRLMTAVGDIFDCDGLLEYTVEAGRPDSITREKLAVIKAHGAGRISVNPQTMNQATLDLIGRRHSIEKTRESFYLARDMGFTNINMDFILGLPGEGYEELSRSMAAARELGPDSLTFHCLAVKRAGMIRQVMREGAADEAEERLLSSRITEEDVELAADTARALGMEAYYLYRQQSMTGNFENTGYSLPGKEGIYNIVMMEEVSPVMAAGAGTVSKLLVPPASRERHPSLKDIERVENVKNVDEYMARIDDMLARKARKVEEIYGT